MESPSLLEGHETEDQQCLGSTSKKKKTMESTAGGSLDTNPFDSLPTEILQKIIGHLPVHERIRVERVCKRWKNVSTEEVWKDVQVVHIVETKRLIPARGSSKKSSKFIKMEDDKLFIGVDKLLIGVDKPFIGVDKLRIIQCLLSRAGQWVKKFIFGVDIFPAPGSAILLIIAEHCRNIEIIDSFIIHTFDVEEFMKLCEINKQLRSISCRDGTNFIGKLPLRDWKSLDIMLDLWSTKVWGKELVVLIKNSPSLEKLLIPKWTANILEAILNCKQLENLSFPNFRGVEIHDQLMNSSWLNRLTCLEITGSWSNIDLLINFLRQCTNLKNLDFRCLFRELPLILERAVLPLEKLESLGLNPTHCTNEILIHLLKFKHLKIHQSRSRQSITENGILKMIMESECLEELDISEMDVTMRFFLKLARNVRERHKILKIGVSPEIYRLALKICKSPKIQIIRGKKILDLEKL